MVNDDGWQEVRRGKRPMEVGESSNSFRQGPRRPDRWNSRSGPRVSRPIPRPVTGDRPMAAGNRNSGNGSNREFSYAQALKSNVPLVTKFPIAADAQKVLYCHAVEGVVHNSIQQLMYLDPIEREGKKRALIKNEARLTAEAGWKNCILFYAVGPRPYFKALESFTVKMWKTDKKITLQSRENGFFVARFVSEKDCNAILSQGPWFFNKNLIIMRKLTPDMKTDKDLLISMPVWVRFPGLSFNLWGSQAVSALASLLGTPIKMDLSTATKDRISFARVLIEMKSNVGFPDVVEGVFEDGSEFMQKVEYENPPLRCDSCVCFGHVKEECPTIKGWVPAVKNSANKNSEIPVGPKHGDLDGVINKK